MIFVHAFFFVYQLFIYTLIINYLSYEERNLCLPMFVAPWFVFR